MTLRPLTVTRIGYAIPSLLVCVLVWAIVLRVGTSPLADTLGWLAALGVVVPFVRALRMRVTCSGTQVKVHGLLRNRTVLARDVFAVTAYPDRCVPRLRWHDVQGRERSSPLIAFALVGEEWPSVVLHNVSCMDRLRSWITDQQRAHADSR